MNAEDEITELKKRSEELPGEIYTIAWIKCGDGPSRPVKFYVRDYRRPQDQKSHPEQQSGEEEEEEQLGQQGGFCFFSHI